MTKPTIEQAHQLGQKIVNLIAEECGKHGTNDLNMVFNVLVSVIAHYIGGVTPQEARQKAYNQVGAWLANHLDQMERDGAPHAQVVTTKEEGGTLQ